jgi:hypothetical protein
VWLLTGGTVSSPDLSVHIRDHFVSGRVAGTTNDASAVIAAIAALPATGGDIAVGREQVRIASSVTINKPVRFIGAHRDLAKITVALSGAFIAAAHNVTFEGIHLTGSGAQYMQLFSQTQTTGAWSGWRFHRCRFTAIQTGLTAIGRLVAGGSPATTGTGHSSDIQVTDCEIANVNSTYGMEVGGIDGFLMDRCAVHDNGIDSLEGEGIKILAGTTNYRVSNSRFWNNTRDGVDAYDSLHGTFIGNEFFDNDANGIEIKFTTTDGHPVDRMIVIGNQAHGNGAEGFHVSVPTSVIVGNTAWQNTGSGIRLGAPVDAPTTGNTERTVIANNVCYDNTLSGISLADGATEVDCSHNQTNDNGSYGISVGSRTARCNLIGNIAFANSGGRGLSVYGTGHALVGNRTQDGNGSAYIDTTATLITTGTTNEYVQSRLQNLVTNGSGLLGTNYNFTNNGVNGFTFDPVDTHGGGGSFRRTSTVATILSDEYIPVDPSKYLRLIGWGKAGDVGGANYDPANKQYFGIECSDADKLNVHPRYFQKHPGSTDTTLAAQLNPGDTTVTLTDATGWHNSTTAYARNFLWWPYTNTKGYTYENYTYSRNSSSNFHADWATNGAWLSGGITGNVITLRQPWAGDTLPVGTPVRNATSGSGYKYIAASNVTMPNTWTRYEGYIGTVDTLAVNNTNQFSPGTAYVKLLFLVNNAGAGTTPVRWSDLALTELSGRNLEAATALVPGVVTFGTTAGTAMEGNDTRIGGLIDVYTGGATWTKPTWATKVTVLAIGGGGGGGAGARRASGTATSGGGGGAGGAYSSNVFRAADLPATVAVAAGAGGAGAAATTTDDTNGAAGTAGAASTFGPAGAFYLRAPAGGAGTGGNTGVASGGNISAGLSNGTAGGACNAGAAGTASSGASFGATGGGGGGGISAGGAAAAGGASGQSTIISASPVAGGAINTNGGTGVSGLANSAVAGSGGLGGSYGAGGGGGGSSLNGNNSGAGGSGGPGIVVVIAE